MRVLDRYILRRFCFILFFSLIAFVCIFLIVDSIERLDVYIGEKVPGLIVLKLYVYYLPYIIILTLPVAMLLASLFSVGNMARQNEIVAMSASGVSLYRTLMPLLVLAFLISIVAYYFGEYVVPQASSSRALLIDHYVEKKRESHRKRINNPFMRDDRNRLISMRYFDAARNTGHHVSIRRFEGLKLLYRLDCRTMAWEDSAWVLRNGVERIFDQGQETVALFEEKRLEDENLRPQDFAKVLKKPEEMSYQELTAFIEEVRQNGGNESHWLVDLYLKLSIPFANFIIVLFGAPLASPKRRSGGAAGFGLSLIICFVYFGLVKICQSFGQNGVLPPLFAAWFPNGFFALSGLLILLRTQK
ncbi:LPS export ABC transporter permease LptG [bacterium]|nr:LPS export ABC transporter permease LptG [bacterium]